MSQLHDKNILVTGALGGIGSAICLAYARQGAAIIVHDRVARSEEAVGALTDQLKVAGAREVCYQQADLASQQAIHEMFTRLREEGRDVDILVNNAAIQKTASIEAFPDDLWESIIAINLVAVYHCTKQALVDMRRKGWGRIINLASVHGLVASVGKSAYVSAKHGVVGFTREVALETAREDITVNAICPGWTDTPIIAPQIEARQRALGSSREEAVRDLVSEKQPDGRLIPPAHVAELALFLGGESARHITGTAMPIDGGWTCV
ncbi:3-hydroxybutyrate dehydrogenase [Halomonas chromatireducens]|uniref:D-beta-hydroxybutyrate dehydrogenase n=1 Tax=Halomonas chromatireducens TaxID=507626 RepID=A0A125R0P3_9GAMM|nr:3-hydroxybutyrate dehydrogenase [Halomonas chromatireducens]AMD02427.1 D-beta-hydroxybutyrate dehydrogenase [Halomonas chromatireducens]